jgi:hypothetical protein
MTPGNVRRLVVTTLLIAGGTWVAGWWAVPVIGLMAGLLLTPAWIAGLASGLAWAILLGVDLFSDHFGRLAAMLGSVMGLPSVSIIALTLLFPAPLGWSAAAVGNALRSIRGAGDPARHMSRAD